jgi:enediyne biosynthesis protein E4
LGKPEPGKTVSLSIVWPSGQKDDVANVAPNQFVTVQEGKGIVSARPIVFVNPAEASIQSPAPHTLAH